MAKHTCKQYQFLDLAFKDKRAILIYSSVILGVLLLFVRYVVVLDRESNRVQVQERVLAMANELRSRLEYQINTTLNLTMGSLVYVASHPDISQQEFANFAKVIIQRAPYVQNLGLAKDNVISHIYPLANNKAALGLRYMDNPHQRPAVLRAIKTRKTVIAGPVNLVQGGQGFISRIPIFLNNEQQSYWGISSIVVKVESFFEAVKINQFKSSLAIALRGKDASGKLGEVFYGDPQLFNDQNINLNIPLPVGNWTLAAAPKQGWINDSARAVKIYLIGSCISLLFCLLLYTSLSKNIDLKLEQEKANIANEHKSRFFTNMTHELRTPLTAIYGSIKLLGSATMKPNTKAWINLLGNAERNCQRLICLVNDIVDLKKIESGKMAYKTTSQLIIDIINESIDEVKYYADQFQISISLQHDDHLALTVNVDHNRLVQVISNLLSNAIKYSPTGQAINVTVKQDHDFVCVEVTDNGPGIDVGNIGHIFNEFAQLNQHESGTNKIVASSGLGLSISKQIISDHRGQIGAYNSKTGGAVFFIKLPLVASQAKPQRIAQG